MRINLKTPFAEKDEAKALGVPMGAPAFQYRKLFEENNIHVFSSNFVLYGDMSNLSMGTRDMASMPVLVTNMEKMCASYERCLDGMLGFDFLSMHKIGFNFVKRKMYIWK